MSRTFTRTPEDVKLAQKAIAQRFARLPHISTHLLALRIASGIFFGIAMAVFARLYLSEPALRPTLSNLGWLMVTAAALHLLTKRYWSRSVQREMLSGKGAHLAEKRLIFQTRR